MNYPVWDLAMGGGVLMALVSVLHVFVSHFAVGGGLWLVLTEQQADRRSDPELRAHVKAQSRFFLLITLVFGAITGVGIWSTAALISPHGIIALIRGYVWGWAMEWVFFVVEIAAALVYWYGWERLDARTHRIVGWIYFVAAFMSLVIINGIVTFMLTPGGWLQDHAFWTGFFNPTYWPSAVLRTCASLAMAGLFTLLAASFMKRSATRVWAVRWSAVWVLAGTLLAAASALWYDAALRGAVDAVASQIGSATWEQLTAGAVPILPRMLWYMKLGMAAVALVALWPLAAPRTWNPVGAAALFVAGLVFFGGGEWAREAARKPYTIYGYLYSTGVLVGEAPSDRAPGAVYASDLEADGVIAHTRWLDPDDGSPAALGRDLYRAWCQMCHTMDGYNALRPILAHWSEEQTASFLPRLQYMQRQMPAWPAEDEAVAALAAYLHAEGAQGEAVFPDDPAAARRRAWDLHCGLCHDVAADDRPGIDAIVESWAGDWDSLLDDLDGWDAMPIYDGDATQRALLIEYLDSVAADGEGSES